MAQRNIKQTNKTLIFLLAVQLALVAYMFRPTPERELVDGLLLDGFKADQVNLLSIIDNDGRRISLEKNDSGWAIKSANIDVAPLPADEGKTETLLEKIASLTRSRLVARTPASHSRLKVGQIFNRKIELTTTDGKEKILYLGSSPNYKSIHVRLEGDDEVYMANELSAWEASTTKETWWRTKYVAVDPDNLTSVELTNPMGTINLTKNTTDGQWQLQDMAEGMKLAEEPVQNFLTDITHLTVLEYLPADYQPGEENPVANLKMTTSQVTVSINISPKDKEKNHHVVKSSTISYYALAGTQEVKDILNIPANELMEPIAALEPSENPSP